MANVTAEGTRQKRGDRTVRSVGVRPSCGRDFLLYADSTQYRHSAATENGRICEGAHGEPVGLT